MRSRPSSATHGRLTAPTRSSSPGSAPRRRRWPASSATGWQTRSAAWVGRGRPFLGICLGLQLLYEGSDEDGAETLGLLPGRTVALRDAPTLPHIGWNQVERRRAHPVLDGVPDGADLYFVHSYVVAPADPSTIVAETVHGARFPSVVVSDSVVGLQFHPERSGHDGLRILANFCALAASDRKPSVRSASLAGGNR